MKQILVPLFLLTTCVALSVEPSKPVVPDPYEWSTRVYRFPAEELASGFVSRELGQLHAPPVPPANASADEIMTFLKSSNNVVTQYLLLQGIPLLKGSLAVVDPDKDVLVVRAVNSTQDLIESLAQSFVQRVPHYLSFNTHLVEADEKVVEQIVKDAPAKADHKALWDKMEALIAQGQARHLGMFHLDTRSGQRSRISRGQQQLHADGFSMDNLGWFEVRKLSELVGTEFEIDPVMGPDGRTLDLNLSLKHHFSPPTKRWEPAAQSGVKRIESQVTDLHIAHFTTAITMHSGMTKLLGVWQPTPAPEAARANVMQAAFLVGNIVPVLPLAESRIGEMLKTQGEKVEPTPARAKTLPNEGLPPGMILRRFRVPPDFLSSAADSGGSPAADPFAAKAAPRSESRAMRSVTAMDVLKIAGIPFPEGSSANFSAVSGELIVRNTPANTQMVADFVESLVKKVPMDIGITTHIVQADEALLRRLSTETSLVADHAAAWQTIVEAVAQGKAKILRTSWLETRSGQRAQITAGTEYMHNMDATIADAFHEQHSSASDVKSDNTGSKTEAKPAAQLPASTYNGSHPVLSSSCEMTPVGFRLEVDSVVGPDGHMVDLNFAIAHDNAPPTQHFEPAGGDDKVLRVESPSTDFHQSNLESSITLTSGSIRLLGTWKPEGPPEADAADLLQAAFIRVDVMPLEVK